jgi:hypothetical protein
MLDPQKTHWEREKVMDYLEELKMLIGNTQGAKPLRQFVMSAEVDLEDIGHANYVIDKIDGGPTSNTRG